MSTLPTISVHSVVGPPVQFKNLKHIGENVPATCQLSAFLASFGLSPTVGSALILFLRFRDHTAIDLVGMLVITRTIYNDAEN